MCVLGRGEGVACVLDLILLFSSCQYTVHANIELCVNDFLCFQNVVVEAPPGMIVGYVCQFWSLCKPGMRIKNATEEIVLSIKGSGCQVNICGDINFDVSIVLSP